MTFDAPVAAPSTTSNAPSSSSSPAHELNDKNQSSRGIKLEILNLKKADKAAIGDAVAILLALKR